MNGSIQKSLAEAQPERNSAAAVGAQPSRLELSLRTKGYIVFAALIVYSVTLISFMVSERNRLLVQFQEIAVVLEQEEHVARLYVALSNASLNINELSYAKTADARGLSIAIEPVFSSAQQLSSRSQVLDNGIERLHRRVEELRGPVSRGNVIDLRTALTGLIGDIEVLSHAVKERRVKLSAGYQKAYDSVTLISMVFGILGLVVFGALITLFFARLAADIRELSHHAREVVKGHRGVPIAVTRADEIGQLMQDVNNMEQELVRREAQIEISRQQYFHREKMASIGSLAAGIAHEIGNPIAAIAGVAQAIAEEREARSCPSTGAACRPDLILEQTNRISLITREISEFSAQRPVNTDWLDLNGLVRSTCNFMRYDRRFRNISLTLELDHQLPAAMAVEDHVVQVLMNLLANAADAVHEVPGRVPVVVVRTRRSGSTVYLEVQDNGCGMDENTRAQACEAFFTTKPPGKGTGLGLAMSRSILESAGGGIEIESLKNVGSTVRILLSIDQVASNTGQ